MYNPSLTNQFTRKIADDVVLKETDNKKANA